MKNISITPNQIEEARRKYQMFWPRRLWQATTFVFSSVLFFTFVFFTIRVIEAVISVYDSKILSITLVLVTIFGFDTFTTFVHELGHLVAGRHAGFHLLRFAFSFFMITRTPDGLRPDFGRGHMGGYVVCVPEHDDDLAHRWQLFVLGGPIATLFQFIILLLAVWLLHTFMQLPVSVVLWLFLVALFVLYILLLTVVPFSFGGALNDGAIIRILRQGGDRAEFLLTQVRLLAQSAGGKRPCELNAELITLLSDLSLDGSESMLANVTLYEHALDSGDVTTAAVYLDNALACLLEHPQLATAALPLLEAAYFEAIFGHNATNARSWLELSKIQKPTPGWLAKPQDFLRAEAAVLLAEGQHQAARAYAQKALARLEQDYDIGHTIAEREWLEQIITKAGERPAQNTIPPANFAGRKPIQKRLQRVFSFLISFVAVLFIAGCVAMPLFVLSQGGLRNDLLGIYYEVRGDQGRALQAFERGIQEDPQYPHTYTNRGEIYMQQKTYQAAIADFDKAISLKQDSYRPYMLRGISHYHLDEYELVIADLTKSLELDPSCKCLIAIYLYRAAAYAATGEHELAVADYLQANALTDDPEKQAFIEESLNHIGYSGGE